MKMLQITFALLSFAFLSMFSACGGGGGGGSSGKVITVSGSIHDDPATARQIERVGIPNIKVCALTGCATTDANGDYAFSVEIIEFDGGAILFTFVGNGLDTKTVVSDIIPGTTDIVADFFIGEQSRVEIEKVEQSSDSSSSSSSSSANSSSSSSVSSVSSSSVSSASSSSANSSSGNSSSSSSVSSSSNSSTNSSNSSSSSSSVSSSSDDDESSSSSSDSSDDDDDQSSSSS